MPYGGKNQLTEAQAMVAKVPVAKGNTDAVTMMSYGFNPYLSSVESISWCCLCRNRVYC